MNELKLLKLLLSHEFYLENKHRVHGEMFPGVPSAILSTIKAAHEAYERDLTVDEVGMLHFAHNPVLTAGAKAEVHGLLQDINELEPIASDVGKDVVRLAWQTEIGRRMAQAAIDLSDGKSHSLQPIRSLLDSVQEDFVPTDFVEPITSDVEELVRLLDTQSRWKFNIPSLSDVAGGLSGGEFAYILARPELGKTAFWVSLCLAPGGFCEQGGNVVAVINEEPAKRTMMRGISAYTGMTREDIKSHVPRAKALFDPVKDRIKMLDDVEMSIEKLDLYLRHHDVDVLVVDQLDKLQITGTFARTDEALQELYIQIRRLAKKHDIAIIGLTQASAEAEGKRHVTYAMSAGSKTAKAAEADLIIGIGKSPIVDGAEEDYQRVLTLSKNKLTGWHGEIVCVMDAKLSRYLA